MKEAVMILAALAGMALTAAVLAQTTKAEGFSASLGGSDTSRFQKGSRDEMLERVATVAAIVWLGACLAVSLIWFRS